MIDTSKIKTGDIMLVQTNSLLARTIQFFQKRKDKIGGIYNHAAMFQVEGDKIYVIEAIQTGIQKTNFTDEYLNKKRYVNIIGLSPLFDTTGWDFVETMKPYINTTKYDFFDLIVEQSIRFITGKWLFSKTIHTKHFICGEFCAYIYYLLKNSLFSNVYEIAPLDLEERSDFSHYPVKN